MENYEILKGINEQGEVLYHTIITKAIQKNYAFFCVSHKEEIEEYKENIHYKASDVEMITAGTAEDLKKLSAVILANIEGVIKYKKGNLFSLFVDASKNYYQIRQLTK